MKQIKLVVTHGEMDPQRSLGPLEDLNANSPVTVMSRKIVIDFFSTSFKSF